MTLPESVIKLVQDAAGDSYCDDCIQRLLGFPTVLRNRLVCVRRRFRAEKWHLLCLSPRQARYSDANRVSRERIAAALPATEGQQTCPIPGSQIECWVREFKIKFSRRLFETHVKPITEGRDIL